MRGNSSVSSKVFSVLLIFIFLLSGTCLGVDLNTGNTNINAFTAFQRSLSIEGSEDYRSHVASDIKLVSVCRIIAEYVLVEGKDMDLLPRHLRDKFRNDKKNWKIAYELARNAEIRENGNIVTLIMPYERRGEMGTIRISFDREKDTYCATFTKMDVNGIFSKDVTKVAEQLLTRAREKGPLSRAASFFNKANAHFARLPRREMPEALSHLKVFYSRIMDLARDLPDKETAIGFQILAAQGLNIVSWIESDIPYAKDIQLTEKPEEMLEAKDKDRGPSYLKADSLPAGVSDTEGAPGTYWRGVEGVKKLGDNILEAAISDKKKFEAGRDKALMYLMDHGFVSVPEGLTGLTSTFTISTIHETGFIRDRLPGSRQCTSTGPGHFQKDKMDIKYVTSGRGLQYNKFYDEKGELIAVYAQYLKPGTWAVAFPGAVDSVENLEGLRFNDISVLVPEDVIQYILSSVKEGLDPDKILEAGDVISKASAENPYVAVDVTGSDEAVSRKHMLVKRNTSAPDIIWIKGLPAEIFDERTLLETYEWLSQGKMKEKRLMVAYFIASKEARTDAAPAPMKVIDETEAGKTGPETGTAKEEKLKKIEERVDTLNKMYLELIPPVEADTTLIHLVSIELIPYHMRDEFVAMINDVNRNFPAMKEKIYVLTDRQDAGHMIDKLSEEAKGGCIFDVALADTEGLENIPEGVKALVFAGKLGNFRQLSGMLAALRALQQNEAGALIRLFEILTGKQFGGKEADILEVINDPKELAKIIMFNLRPVDGDLTVDDLAPLNRKLLAFIKAA